MVSLHLLVDYKKFLFPGIHSEIEIKLVKEKVINFQPDLLLVFDGWNEMSARTSPEKWKENWVEICEIGEKENFDTIVTLQPIVGTGNRINSEQEIEIFYNQLINAEIPYYELYEEFYEQLEELDEKCTKAADLREIFDHTPEPIYFSPVHVGPLGNQIIAENFYKLSLPIVLEATKAGIVDTEIIPKFDTNLESIEIVEESDFFRIINYYKTPKVVQYLLFEPISKGKSADYSQVQNFYGQKLINENFAGENLENAIFFNTYLENVDFSNANLKGAIFHKSIMNNVIFNDANLMNVKIFSTKIANSDFTRVNFDGAKFLGSFIRNTNFDGTIFDNVSMTHSVFYFIDFKTVQQLSNVNFKDSHFVAVKFSGVDLSTVDFTEAWLTFTDLTNTNLDGTIFTRTDFTGKFVRGEALGYDTAELIKNTGTDGIFLQGVIFSNVDLSGRDLTSAFFYTGTDTNIQRSMKISPAFHNSNLSKTNLSNEDLSFVHFIDSDLSKSDLSSSLLFYTNFQGATLTGANFSNANLTNADLSYANLTNANLTNAIMTDVIIEDTILDCLNHPICN